MDERPRDNGRWLVLAWARLAVAITAATLTAGSRAPSPSGDLAEIRRFVTEHPAARYERFLGGVVTPVADVQGEFVGEARWQEQVDVADAAPAS